MESTSVKSSSLLGPRRSSISLPKIFGNSSARFVSQGAEAIVYQTTYLTPSTPSALKFRPPKPYRHPTLDVRLTKHRILSEARSLARCKKQGVSVPALYAIDEKNGWLMIEWIEGKPVRLKLDECLKNQNKSGLREIQKNGTLKGLMRAIGHTIGKLHSAGIIHGDLTTSNIMIKSDRNEVFDDSEEGQFESRIVLIDFGLSSQSSQDEDRAVDLYVLERAFISTHPQAEIFSNDVIDAYKECLKEADSVLKRLEEVRLRGRKRNMIG